MIRARHRGNAVAVTVMLPSMMGLPSAVRVMTRGARALAGRVVALNSETVSVAAASAIRKCVMG
jgi:hypothetical protein